ncbi:MAG: nucleotide exchange factor GrpE [Anaerolineae bacterium]
MTAIKIPVRVVGTNTRRRGPTLRPEAGRRPQVDPAVPALGIADPPEKGARTPVATEEVVATQEAAATQEVVATEDVAVAQDRLLAEVISIADNLERALAVAREDTPIRQGVAITHRDVLQLLRRHGLERIDAHQQPFDPQWHEAIDVVPARELGVAPGTVVQVMAPGYRRGEQLFRPARVVVAQ